MFSNANTVLSTVATEISQLNMEAVGLSVELQALRTESRELSEGVRRVEGEVGMRRRERERESRAGVAHLHTEAIRLRRELEVLLYTPQRMFTQWSSLDTNRRKDLISGVKLHARNNKLLLELRK